MVSMNQFYQVAHVFYFQIWHWNHTSEKKVEVALHNMHCV